MWQYQNTDELYHSNMYKNINRKSESKLYHSDVYLGKDFSDGIKHYKYLRKYVKNGRTYYIYDNSQEKLNDIKSNIARSIGNQIGKKGYYDDDMYKVKKTKNDKGLVDTWKIRFGSGKKPTKKDKFKKKTQDKMFSIVDKHAEQKIKDTPKKILAKGISAVFKTKMKIDDSIDNVKNKFKKKK